MANPWDRDEPEEISFGRVSLPGPHQQSADGVEDGTAPRARPPRRPGEHDRLVLVVLAALAVGALLVTVVVAWRGTTTGREGAYGLPPDHAACFAYGLLERRLALPTDKTAREARLPTVGQVKQRLRDEIDELDALADRFPEADYRLVDGFSAVADASTAASNADTANGPSLDFENALDRRADALRAANARCGEAGFDLRELEPRDE